MTVTQNNITVFPVADLSGPRQTFTYLKMFFTQEKLPTELYIEFKNVRVKSVKDLAMHYIRSYEYIQKEHESMMLRRSAMHALYWLEILYREVLDQRKNQLKLKSDEIRNN